MRDPYTAAVVHGGAIVVVGCPLVRASVNRGVVAQPVVHGGAALEVIRVRVRAAADRGWPGWGPTVLRGGWRWVRIIP